MSASAGQAPAERPPGIGAHPAGPIARFFDSDLWYNFRRSPVAVIAGAVAFLWIVGALFAPWLAPHDPFDLGSLSLSNSFLPPLPLKGSQWAFPLGTDDQGRDMLSAIMYGGRISLVVGFCSVLFAAIVGVSVGLIAGYGGGALDALLMRIADVQLTFPAILIALVVDGIVSAALHQLHEATEIDIIVFAIGISNWPQFARTVRGSTMVERGKDYVLAARVIGISGPRIMLTHILPNVLGPVLVIATINLAVAIVTEATLSFLGVGLPPTNPSLGTLINNGNSYLFSGQWWITIFPGLALVIMVLSINLLGDWLRDALNPRLS
ncbi:MAG TPA: ABC transporter permease [Acetobacteraceae bacterium]|jgi:peptide/nickel transport system permease protein|nr:ABC transporter permease [Acetobacteraceae bacterium]